MVDTPTVVFIAAAPAVAAFPLLLPIIGLGFLAYLVIVHMVNQKLDEKEVEKIIGQRPKTTNVSKRH